MALQRLQINADSPFRQMVGVGGIGTGLFLALEGEHTLGRNESRPARLLNVQDYCKLHIIGHYIAILLGAPFQVIPVGKVGGDDAGRRLIDEMAAVGMDTRYIDILEGCPTLMSVCLQYADGSGGNLTTSESAASKLTPKDIDRCAELLAAEGPRCIALAVPEVPLETRGYLLKQAEASRCFRVASFASAEMIAAREAGMFSRVDLLAINEDEAQMLVGEALDPANPRPFLNSCAKILLSHQPDIKIIVSAGKHGAFAFAGGSWDYRAPLNVPVASTAGAGDALLAGVLSGLAAGMPFSLPSPNHAAFSDRPIESAFDLGVLLAAYSVTSRHTIHPDANLSTLLSFADEWG